MIASVTATGETDLDNYEQFIGSPGSSKDMFLAGTLSINLHYSFNLTKGRVESLEREDIYKGVVTGTSGKALSFVGHLKLSIRLVK